MKKIILGFSLALMPMVSFAAIGGIDGVMNKLSDLMRMAMPLLLSAAVLFFVYTLVKYMFAGAGQSKDDAKSQMLWGVVILFVMISVWGLVNILADTADLDNNVPTVNWEVQ
ncbi:MAG: hypothetical protein V1851_02820 [Patescibacteria group bacterium]